VIRLRTRPGAPTAHERPQTAATGIEPTELARRVRRPSGTLSAVELQAWLIARGFAQLERGPLVPTATVVRLGGSLTSIGG
jgi:hypothetical protein